MKRATSFELASSDDVNTKEGLTMKKFKAVIELEIVCDEQSARHTAEYIADMIAKTQEISAEVVSIKKVLTRQEEVTEELRKLQSRRNAEVANGAPVSAVFPDLMYKCRELNIQLG